ncbi:translation initiation factor IF-2 [Oryctolagus cuniculus]|uniref:translation initiation factor IF-2 n=1 Tax=Oryctolagus cuniculus TaxID=9986 RepID=UPI00387A4A2D
MPGAHSPDSTAKPPASGSSTGRRCCHSEICHTELHEEMPHGERTPRAHRSTGKQHTQETGWVCNRGAHRAARPRPSPRTRTPKASPVSRVTFQVRSCHPRAAAPASRCPLPRCPPQPLAAPEPTAGQLSAPGPCTRGAARARGCRGCRGSRSRRSRCVRAGGAGERAAGRRCGGGGGVGAAASLLRGGLCRGGQQGGRKQGGRGGGGGGGRGSGRAGARTSRSRLPPEVGSPARAPTSARTVPPETSPRPAPLQCALESPCPPAEPP